MRKVRGASIIALVVIMAIACLFNTTPASAQQKFSNIVLVPTSANNPGRNGSQFKTRVSIFNPTEYDFNIEVYISQNVPLLHKQLWLKRQTHYSWDDFLESMGYRGAGSVMIRSFNGSDESRKFLFSVIAEVYNDVGQGRFSTVIPVVSLSFIDLSSISDPNATYEAYSFGLDVNENRRTNIGCVNMTAVALHSVTASVYNFDGQLVETITFDMLRNVFSWQQKSIITQLTDGYIIWKATGPFTAFAVGVDNKSNDGTLALAASK